MNPTLATPLAGQLKSPPAVDCVASQNMITYGFFKGVGGSDEWQKHMFILKPVMRKSFQLLGKRVSVG